MKPTALFERLSAHARHGAAPALHDGGSSAVTYDALKMNRAAPMSDLESQHVPTTNGLVVCLNSKNVSKYGCHRHGYRHRSQGHKNRWFVTPLLMATAWCMR